MRPFLPIALLSIGALAKSCTPYEAYELNDCLDAAYDKVNTAKYKSRDSLRISIFSDRGV
jgi:hypothetical protein